LKSHQIIIAFIFLTTIVGCEHNVRGGLDGGNESWQIFRGDAGLSGYADVQLSGKLALLWTYKSGAGTTSSPVVYNHTVYWCDRRGKIYGVDAAGKQVFDYDFATAVEASPMIIDSTLYIGRIDGFMSALSLKSKDTLWNFETLGQISASPNTGVFTGREALVFGSYDNCLYCLDMKTG
jgi:outer membrane protein assembly factor BamB